MKYLILMFLLLFVGCASSTLHRDSTGVVWKVTTKGNISAVYKAEGEHAEKIEVDSKYEIFKGIFNLTKVSAA